LSILFGLSVAGGLGWLLTIGLASFLAGLLVVLLGVSWLGGYRVWREGRRDVTRLEWQVAELQDRFETQLVPEEHRAQLRGLLGGLMNAVWRDQPADFADPPGLRPHNRPVIAAHYPELAEKVEEWDAAVTRDAAAGPALRAAAESLADQLGVTDERFDGRVELLDVLCKFVTDRSVAGTLRTPVTLNWGRVDYSGVQGPNPGPGRELELRLSDKVVAHLPAEPGATREHRVLDLEGFGSSLFNAMEQLGEAQEITHARAALEPLKRSLDEDTRELTSVTNVVVAMECPTCRRNLGLVAGA
jgi:hypothetical protein